MLGGLALSRRADTGSPASARSASAAPTHTWFSTRRRRPSNRRARQMLSSMDDPSLASPGAPPRSRRSTPAAPRRRLGIRGETRRDRLARRGPSAACNRPVPCRLAAPWFPHEGRALSVIAESSDEWASLMPCPLTLCKERTLTSGNFSKIRVPTSKNLCAEQCTSSIIPRRKRTYTSKSSAPRSKRCWCSFINSSSRSAVSQGM